MLSPIGNILLSMLSFNIQNKWTFEFFWQVISSSSPGHGYLKIACILVGAWMAITAKRSSWLFALIILGIYIGYGIINFKSQKVISGWFAPTLSLLSNIGFFAFIYFVEFQHSGLALEESRKSDRSSQKTFTPTRKKEDEPLFPLEEMEGFVLDFEGFGPWAQIERCTQNEILVYCFQDAPKELLKKPVEIFWNDTHLLQFELTKNEKDYYVFQLTKVISKESDSAHAA